MTNTNNQNIGPICTNGCPDDPAHADCDEHLKNLLAKQRPNEATVKPIEWLMAGCDACDPAAGPCEEHEELLRERYLRPDYPTGEREALLAVAEAAREYVRADREVAADGMAAFFNQLARAVEALPKRSDAPKHCIHEWTHHCKKCQIPSELDEITETERSSAVKAFAKIEEMTEHDSEINIIAAQELSSLFAFIRSDKWIEDKKHIINQRKELAQKNREVVRLKREIHELQMIGLFAVDFLRERSKNSPRENISKAESKLYERIFKAQDKKLFLLGTDLRPDAANRAIAQDSGRTPPTPGSKISDKDTESK